MRQFFPSWLHLKRNEAVVVFMVGLMENPKLLVNYIYELYIDTELERLRSTLWDEDTEKLELELESEGKNLQDLRLLNSLFFESRVSLATDPYHNQFVNIYQHMNDDEMKRPRDTKPVHIPSRLYLFSFIKQPIDAIPVSPESSGENDASECAMGILQPLSNVTKSLLALCHQVSEYQAVTDFYMLDVSPEDMTKLEVPNMSSHAKSLWLWECELPTEFVRSILRQLSSCVTLQMLWLRDINLSSVEGDLDELLENLVAHHRRMIGAAHYSERLELVLDRNSLSQEFKTKWRQCCKRVSSIKYQIW